MSWHFALLLWPNLGIRECRPLPTEFPWSCYIAVPRARISLALIVLELACPINRLSQSRKKWLRSTTHWFSPGKMRLKPSRNAKVFFKKWKKNKYQCQWKPVMKMIWKSMCMIWTSQPWLLMTFSLKNHMRSAKIIACFFTNCHPCCSWSGRFFCSR